MERDSAIKIRMVRDSLGVMLSNPNLHKNEYALLMESVKQLCGVLHDEGYRVDVGREGVEYDSLLDWNQFK